jgi:hypothetical protein
MINVLWDIIDGRGQHAMILDIKIFQSIRRVSVISRGIPSTLLLERVPTFLYQHPIDFSTYPDVFHGTHEDHPTTLKRRRVFMKPWIDGLDLLGYICRSRHLNVVAMLLDGFYLEPSLVMIVQTTKLITV